MIERIARLAQRTPSAGFSQGQRLVVVTDPERRARSPGSAGRRGTRPSSGRGSASAPRQFIPCVSEAIYHRRYQEPDKIVRTATEFDWPVPYWWVDIGATMQNIMLAAVDEGLGCGFIGPTRPARRSGPLLASRVFQPIGVMPVGNPAGHAVARLKRGWVPFHEFVRWDRWD